MLDSIVISGTDPNLLEYDTVNLYTFDEHVTQHPGLQNHQDSTATLKDVPQFGNFELDTAAIER